MQSDPVSKSQNDSGIILGDGTDFSSPCVSVLTLRQDQYSDISKDEFDIPSSQQFTNRM